MHLGEHPPSPPLSASAWCRSLFLQMVTANDKFKIQAQNCITCSSCVPRCLLLSLHSFTRTSKLKSLVIHKVCFCIYHSPCLFQDQRGVIVHRSCSLFFLFASFAYEGEKLRATGRNPAKNANSCAGLLAWFLFGLEKAYPRARFGGTIFGNAGPTGLKTIDGCLLATEENARHAPTLGQMNRALYFRLCG